MALSLSTAAWGFIVFWIFWVNHSFMCGWRRTLCGKVLRRKDTLKNRFFEWLIRLPVVLLSGFSFDDLFYNRPHAAYANWDFYATLLFLSLVFTLPGLGWYLYRKSFSSL